MFIVVNRLKEGAATFPFFIMDIYKTISKYAKLDFGDVIFVVLNQDNIKELIIELQQERLYERGTDSNGASLGDYSDYTVEIKREKGQRYDHITLRDTGEFYESFTVTVVKDGIVLDANPNKENTNLFSEYGIDILGLDDFSFNIVKDQILVEMYQYIVNKL